MTSTYVPANEGVWLDNPDGAGCFRILRLHEGGGTTVEVAIPAGAEGRLHRHPAGEELVVLEGQIEIGRTMLRAGDYLHTPPGAVHRVRAITNARFVLVLPALPEYL